LKILLLATDIYTHGGVARYSATLASALGECLGQRNVDVLALLDWGSREDAPGGVRVVETIGSEVGLASKLRYARHAWRLARQHYDLIVATHVAVAPIAAMLRLTYGTPYWVACHGWEVWERLSPIKWAALRGAERLLPVSQFTAEKLRSVQGFSGCRMRVFYNAVPPSFASRLMEANVAQDPLSGPAALPWRQDSSAALKETLESAVVASPETRSAGRIGGPEGRPCATFLLSVGGVSKASGYKGIDTVIRTLPRILAAVPTVRYVVVGEGDNRRELECLAQRESVRDHVDFVGEVGDAELARLYQTCRLLVMPSRASGKRTGEGFGRVYTEAALAGKPVVASRAGGAAEAVLDGETGLLVDPDSPEAIAATAVRLLTNPALAAAMGRRARTWAAENFTMPALRRALEEMLESHRRGAEAQRKGFRFSYLRGSAPLR